MLPFDITNIQRPQVGQFLLNEVGQNSLIGEVKNLFPPDLCRAIIDRFEFSNAQRQQGQVASGTTVKIKVSTDLPIMASDPMWADLDTKIFQTLHIASELYMKTYPFLSLMPLDDSGYLIQKYDANSGHYDWHIDSGTLQMANRMVACVIYLNTISDGGETEFAFQNIKVRAEEGKVVLFPAFWTHPHRGCMPTSESKYIITTFFILQPLPVR